MIRSRQLWPLGLAIGVLAGLAGAIALWWTLLRADDLDIPAPPPQPLLQAARKGPAMTLYAENGAQLTKAAAQAKTAAVPVTDPLIRVAENLYVGHRADGTTFPGSGRKLKFAKDTIIPRSKLDACFPAAIVTTISPANGPAAGGTQVTIKGANFTPGSTVTFGGTAATGVTVVDESTIRCTTPAEDAGAADVAVTTDADTVTKTGAFTYA
ncbi:IPT/TIG domain-containing protein [Nonomuraea turkmeniaca]|uniref:IPT/TIG domain-containing protein n=1 Tax=Nonomuraea turkmeniaca TaxID=103838 RepID=UPI0014772482|nr:IPT/TIG domain-containing protein [Nonomuraea turkmeniaca]